MKKFFLASALLAQPLFAQAQRQGFAIGLSTSADVYRYAALYPGFLDFRFKIRSSIGLQAHYAAENGLTFSTGLLLSNKGWFYKGYGYVPLASQTPPTYTTNGTELYLDLPLKLGYSIRLAQNVAITPTAGVISSFFLAIGGKIEESNGQVKKFPLDASFAFERRQYSIPVEVHVDLLLTDKLQLSAAPYYRFGINIDGSEEFRGGVSSYGLLLDGRYYLGRSD